MVQSQEAIVYIQICVAPDLILQLIYILGINDSIFKLRMTIDSGVLLKNHISCNFMLKYRITILLRQFTKSLNQFLMLSRASGDLEICMPILFEQLNESKQF